MNAAAALVAGAAACAFAAFLRGVCSLRSGFFGPALTEGDPSSGAIALTFDDGPDPDSTPALLDYLGERGVRAAFFVVGRRVDAHPELTRRIVAEGHVVGNHAYRHAWHTNFLSAKALARELAACNAAVERAAGVVPTLYRPPFGLANPATFKAARALGLAVVGWSARGRDLPGTRPAAAAARVLRRVASGAVVLLHDGGRPAESVVAATRLVVEGARRRGLRCAGLDDVLFGRRSPPSA